MTAEMSVQITLALSNAFSVLNPSAGIGRQDGTPLFI